MEYLLTEVTKSGQYISKFFPDLGYVKPTWGPEDAGKKKTLHHHTVTHTQRNLVFSVFFSLAQTPKNELRR